VVVSSELPRGCAWERATLRFPQSFSRVPSFYFTSRVPPSVTRACPDSSFRKSSRPGRPRCADISRVVTLLSPRASPRGDASAAQLPLSLPCRGNREDADGLFRRWNCSSAPTIIEFAAQLKNEHADHEGYEN